MAAGCTNMEIISCERYEIGAIGESMALFFSAMHPKALPGDRRILFFCRYSGACLKKRRGTLLRKQISAAVLGILFFLLSVCPVLADAVPRSE